MAWRLAEQGALDVDATVRTYLPDFKVVDEEASARATVRHLMPHTGGWVGDLFEDTGSGDEATSGYVSRSSRTALCLMRGHGSPANARRTSSMLPWEARRRVL